MTHASMSEEKRKEIGINSNLVRLSRGIEEPEDLVKDLQRELEEI